MRPLEKKNKQGVGFQRQGGTHSHSIVQANYHWKIITTDGSRAANLCRSGPGAAEQMMKCESGVGGGGTAL